MLRFNLQLFAAPDSVSTLPSDYVPQGLNSSTDDFNFDDVLAQIPLIGSLTGATSRYNNRLNQYATEQAQKFATASAREAMAFESLEAQKQREFNSAEAGISREFNSAEAQKQRDFQREMDSTKYQRMMSDMSAAGLNPILAYQGMSGSTPSGSSASSNPATAGGKVSGHSVASSAKANFNFKDVGLDFVQAAMPFILMGLNSGKTAVEQGLNIEKLESVSSLNSAKTKYYAQKAISEIEKQRYYSNHFRR